MSEADLKTLKNQAETDISAAKDIKELEAVFRRYQKEINLLFKRFSKLPENQRGKWGRAVNLLKSFLETTVSRKKEFLQKAESQIAINDFFDPDKPGKMPEIGHLHPLTQTKREIMAIFASMGFDVALGPEIEDEWHNFDALNIPKDHPARDAWNTIWLKPENKKLLLRTHTSPVQARYLMTHQPPFRIIAPGKVFRYEATDASHEAQFYQLEGLMVDRKVSAANFKAIIGEFLKRFFDKSLKFRLRPDFFPFTEPSFDVAMTCLACSGKGRSGPKGCPVCKRTGWLEVAGAGLVHPNVFTACGLNPEIWKGWAFGFGWDRLAMMKYKIDDIRLFNSGDLRFLEQF
ncbi:MAG: phenylalanine--tRNA ligase subunit alpha [Candidatus Wildermuthbacteria bacterium GWA2_46_15]|uniref:Phenylalanine--tRNA ligase alpha subunit n=1 Tax=Candidatus Wildermuthbacteria bacterium GWA2_46_15 TaxID=1802443 RepID=A0A1G2QQN1_9BACT|nr:MAG: phenylalanine--tRNA ligase subunit alpha [Candidatus Wildermuthbacteria bacterium GWA2_46_15]